MLADPVSGADVVGSLARRVAQFGRLFGSEVATLLLGNIEEISLASAISHNSSTFLNKYARHQPGCQMTAREPQFESDVGSKHPAVNRSSNPTRSSDSVLNCAFSILCEVVDSLRFVDGPVQLGAPKHRGSEARLQPSNTLVFFHLQQPLDSQPSTHAAKLHCWAGGPSIAFDDYVFGQPRSTLLRVQMAYFSVSCTK